jgi:hypothetical protein
MRIPFKSIVITGEKKTRTFTGDTETTTTYDLNSVGEHTLDMPRWRFWLHPGIPWRVAAFNAIPCLLFLLWADFDPLAHPYIFFVPTLAFAAFWYLLCVWGVRNLEMDRLARQERQLRPEVKISCIPDDTWPLFLAELKKPGVNDEVQTLIDGMKDITDRAVSIDIARREAMKPKDDNQAIRLALAAEGKQAWAEALTEWEKAALSDNVAVAQMARQHITAIQSRREA